MKRKFLIGLLITLMLSSNNSSQITQAQEEAGQAFRKIQISNPKILKDQAIISYKKGGYQEALNYLENIESNSRDEEILLLAANCYESLGNSQKAAEYIAKTIIINPENSYAYYNLGILDYNSGNIKKALESFNMAIKYNKNFSAAYYNAGNCYYVDKEYKKAVKSFLSAIKITPNSPNIYFNLSLAYEALKDTKNAQKYYDIYKTLNN